MNGNVDKKKLAADIGTTDLISRGFVDHLGLLGVINAM